MFPNDSDLDTKFTFETENATATADDLPFNILLLGNWKGKSSDSTKDAETGFRSLEVDRDNYEEVLRKLKTSLDLKFSEADDNTIKLEFAELDDFHPDNIFQRISLFADLRDIRRKLSNVNTYNEAASEVRSWLGNDNSADESDNFTPDNSKNNAPPDQNALLDQILNQSSEDINSASTVNTASTELSALIKKLVKPLLIQIDTDEQANLLLIVDEIVSDLMRKIIHHPEFQALESAWRGLYLLVRKIETSNSLRIFIADVDQPTLYNDLKANEDLTESNIYRLLNDSERNWAVVGGNYTFGLSVDDTAALMRLAKIGFNANVPFISAIQPVMFGFESFDTVNSPDKIRFAEDSKAGKLWNVLRELPEATHLGLALPRFLARLPYGEKTEPTEKFYFEEFTENFSHEQFLWANPSFICLLLLAQSFRESGWKLTADLMQNLDGLPVYYYQENTEIKTKSCAEFTMTQSNAEILIEQGLMPLISFRDTDRVRVGRFQSIAFSESMLKGKWQ